MNDFASYMPLRWLDGIFAVQPQPPQAENRSRRATIQMRPKHGERGSMLLAATAAAMLAVAALKVPSYGVVQRYNLVADAPHRTVSDDDLAPRGYMERLSAIIASVDFLPAQSIDQDPPPIF